MKYNLDNLERDMSQELYWLMKEYHMSAVGAIDYMNHNIFVKHSHWFNSLSEEDQWRVRTTIKAMELVHKA